MISLFILNDSFDKIMFAFHLWCAKKQLTNLGDEVHIHPPPTVLSNSRPIMSIQPITKS